MWCLKPGLDDRPGQSEMPEVVFVPKSKVHGKLCLVTGIT